MCSPTRGGGSGCADAPRRTRRAAPRAEPRDRRVGQRLQHPERLGLLRGDDVGDVGDGRGGHARRVGAPASPRSAGCAGAPPGARRGRPVLDAVGVRRGSAGRRRAPGRPRAPQSAANRRSLPAATMSSPSPVGSTWYGATIGKTVPLGRRDGPVREVADEVVPDVGERGLVQRRVDGGALARPLALEEGRRDPERGPHPGPHVDQRRPDADARASRLAGHADEPARRLHQRVVARLLAQRARRRRTRRSSSRRAAGCARGAPGAEPEPLGEPGAQALQEDVRAVGEPEDDLAPALVAQRHRERALARR